MDVGYVHVYTGDGKGKTTAALGLALRAVCAGKKVYFGQFIKGMEYSELSCVDYLPNIEIHQFGRDCFIEKEPTDEDRMVAREGLNICKAVIAAGRHDLVVLDELNIATLYKLFEVDEVVDMIKNKPRHVELVITGRRADPRVIDLADLVTEMKEIKHYYQKGIQARKGIEF